MHHLTVLGQLEASEDGPRSTLPRRMQVVAVLVGLVCLAFVMEPVHVRTVTGADSVLDAWQLRLPLVALAGAVLGVLAGWLTAVSSTRTAFAVAWPMTFYAAFAWIFYAWLTGLASDEVGAASELASRATPLLTLVTAFPLAAFVCCALACQREGFSVA